MNGGDTHPLTPPEPPVPAVAWFGTIQLTKRQKPIPAKVLRYDTGEATLVAIPPGRKLIEIQSEAVWRFDPGIPTTLMLELLKV